MILYPTETIYALGVQALDLEQLLQLYRLKGREATKVASWLVRDVEDIKRYAVMGDVAERIAKEFLPGPLTLVLPARSEVPKYCCAPDRTIGFRISSDEVAQQVVNDFMGECSAPLTCTSANVSGLPTGSTVSEILHQFGEKAGMIDEIRDNGPRTGVASTVIRVMGSQVEVVREGAIPELAIMDSLRF